MILDETELIGALISCISSIIGDREEFIGSILAQVQTADPERERSALEARQKKLKVKAERYREMFVNDLLTIEELKEKLSAIEGEIKELETLEIPDDAEEKCQQHRREILRFLDMETFTNADLRRILDHIAVDKDGNVRVMLKQLEIT